MNHIHRQAALSLLKSGHSVTAATVQGGWRGRPDAPGERGDRDVPGNAVCTPLWPYMEALLAMDTAVGVR